MPARPSPQTGRRRSSYLANRWLRANWSSTRTSCLNEGLMLMIVGEGEEAGPHGEDAIALAAALGNQESENAVESQRRRTRGGCLHFLAAFLLLQPR